MTDNIETPATIETTSGNALLCLDWDEEVYYVVLGPKAVRRDLLEIEHLLAKFGLEMMEEDEHPAEPMADGGKRIWCAFIAPGLMDMAQEATRWKD